MLPRVSKEEVNQAAVKTPQQSNLNQEMPHMIGAALNPKPDIHYAKKRETNLVICHGIVECQPEKIRNDLGVCLQNPSNDSVEQLRHACPLSLREIFTGEIMLTTFTYISTAEKRLKIRVLKRKRTAISSLSLFFTIAAYSPHKKIFSESATGTYALHLTSTLLCVEY